MAKNKKKFSIVSIVLFLAVLMIPGAIWGVGNLFAADGFKTLDYDLGEKRNKAEFPKEFTSASGREIEAYYNDRLPFRSMIIGANRKLNATLEKPYEDIIAPYLVKAFYEQDAQETQTVIEKPPTLGSEENIAQSIEKTEQNLETEEYFEEAPEETQVEENPQEALEYLPPKLYEKTTIAGRDGWLFFAKENALDDYLGNNIYDDATLEEYLEKMVRLQELCDAKGKKLYFMIPPNKEQVYAEKMPSYEVVDEYKRAQRLVDYVQKNSDIQIIYPIDELRAAKDVCQIYFKTDTHWTEAGAYVGVQALYELMGIPTTDIRSLSKTSSSYLGGDLLLLGNLNQEDYADDIRYHLDYRMDLGVTANDGGQFVDDIFSTVSTCTNRCNAVLVGDSFRLFMAEYLSKDFDHYTHIHRKCLDDSRAIEAINNADIIIVESVERLNNFLPETLDGVCEILEK